MTHPARAAAEEPAKPGESKQGAKDEAYPSYASFDVRAKITSVAQDGILCTGSVKPAKERTFVAQRGPFMIFGNFPDAVAGHTWRGSVWAAGQYQYTASDGTSTAVSAWAVSGSLAVQKLNPLSNGEDQIKAPFNLPWGTPEAMLRGLLKDAKAEVAGSTIEKDGAKELAVKSLVAMAGARQTFFELKNDGLCRVTIEYSRPDWNEGKYLDYLNQLKRVVTKQFGEGAKIEAVGADASVMEGYTWSRSATLISVKYIEASDNEGLKLLVTYATKA